MQQGPRTVGSEDLVAKMCLVYVVRQLGLIAAVEH